MISGLMKGARSGLALASMGLLAGCAFAGIATPPPTLTYDLIAPAAGPSHRHPAHDQLVIAAGETEQALDNDHILIKPAPDRIAYFSDSAWGDRLPRLVRLRLAQTLEARHLFRGVGTEDARFSANRMLQIGVRAFQVEIARADGSTAANAAPMRIRARVTIHARLSDLQTGSVLASHEFTATAPAASDGVSDGVAAMTQAFDEATHALIAWLARRTGRGGPRTRTG